MLRVFSDPIHAAVAVGATGAVLATWWMQQKQQTSSHESATEAAFFLVLPVDIQLSILTTWLTHAGDENTLLHVLSVLDVACCNHTLRSDFLTLAKHPAIVWADFCCDDYLSIGRIEEKRDTASFLKWLQSRVTKRDVVLHLDQLSNLKSFSIAPLEYIDTIVLFGVANTASGDALKVVLQACPNLTSLTFPGADDLWVRLQDLIPNIQLKILIFHGVVTVLPEFVACCRLGLVEVRAPFFEGTVNILNLLVSHAATLKVLEINCKVLPLNNVLEFVQQCQVLEELVLTEFEIGTNAEAEAIAHATKYTLKKFVLSGPYDEDCYFDTLVDHHLFADLLERCLWLETIHVINFSYDRTTGELFLMSSRFKQVDDTLIDRIASLNICVRS